MDNQDNYCLWTKLVELAGQALSKMDLRELAAAPHPADG
jgi:DNA-binding IclR family transcriptional regulator